MQIFINDGCLTLHNYLQLYEYQYWLKKIANMVLIIKKLAIGCTNKQKIWFTNHINQNQNVQNRQLYSFVILIVPWWLLSMKTTTFITNIRFMERKNMQNAETLSYAYINTNHQFLTLSQFTSIFLFVLNRWP